MGALGALGAARIIAAMRLVIIERDGVLCVEREGYLRSPDDWQAQPGALEAIAQLNHAGYQVVAINKGERDGMQSGTVLALLSAGARVVDKTDARREPIQLPDERNGLGMVFRTFDRVSYVLVMEVSNPVQVGDKLINPR